MPLVTMEEKTLLLCYDEKVETVTEEDGTTTLYIYESTRVPRMATYGDLVSAIIEGHYTDDAMIAIINNHLIAPTGEHEEEYNAMQRWRTHAKEIAKEVLKALER